MLFDVNLYSVLATMPLYTAVYYTHFYLFKIQNDESLVQA